MLRLTIDRPERKGSLDVSGVRRIVEALEAAATDDSLRVILISSHGATSVPDRTGWPATTRVRNHAPEASNVGPRSRRTASSPCCLRCSCRWSVRYRVGRPGSVARLRWPPTSPWRWRTAGSGCPSSNGASPRTAVPPGSSRGWSGGAGERTVAPGTPGHRGRCRGLGHDPSGRAGSQADFAVDGLVDELAAERHRRRRPYQALPQRCARWRHPRGDGARVPGPRVVLAHQRLPRGAARFTERRDPTFEGR